VRGENRPGKGVVYLLV